MKQPTEAQLVKIKDALAKFQSGEYSTEARALPNFETRYRTKNGVNLVGSNTNVNYVPVSDEERQRKAGGGRKAKTVTNIYFEQTQAKTDVSSKLTSTMSKNVRANLSDVITGITRVFIDKKGVPLVSYRTMMNLVQRYEGLNAKILMDDLGYGKSQAYRIFDVWKLLMSLNVDLAYFPVIVAPTPLQANQKLTVVETVHFGFANLEELTKDELDLVHQMSEQGITYVGLDYEYAA